MDKRGLQSSSSDNNTMSGNTIGKIFRVTTYGESHGVATGGVIDGCPAGLALNMDLIRQEISRRKASEAPFSTSRLEEDEPQFLSGIFEGITTGAPIAFLVVNKAHEPKAYTAIRKAYRPGHGDFSWHVKYGHFDHRGGGRYSARETLARVVAGAIARQFLDQHNISVQAWVSGAGPCVLHGYGPYTREQVEASVMRCPDADISEQMLSEVAAAVANRDTLGGTISCSVTGVNPGLGEPVFDKVEAELAKAMMSIPSVKGFEMGDGFQAATKRGSEHIDQFALDEQDRITTLSNHAGGTLGGLTSGSPINFRVAFKPVSSLKRRQETLSHEKAKTTIDLSTGRHDVCVVPRAVPVVEAMACIMITDLLLRNRSVKR
jgi:chorismate synthase